MEAAKIDGANFYQIYFKIMRQQASPLALTLGLLLFINKWNDYMSPLLYLPEKPTLATGLYRYQTIVERNGNYPVLFAGLFMCLLPILIIFSIFSDKMMNNINIGGLKG
jgi:ABC-type glycerol-3-phosphate transport system permease component